MKYKNGILLTMAAVLLLAGVAQAQTGTQAERSAAAAGYELSWWTVDGGGDVRAGSPGFYTLSGSIGQPDAGLALSNGDYILIGGFWGGVATQFRIRLPLLPSNYP